MKRKTLMLLSLFLISFTALIAQDDKKEDKKEEDKIWEVGGGLGLDFAQMLLINPKVGAGENKIAFGGNTSFSADYNKGRASWENKLSLNFGVQKLGAWQNPFQKTVDELRLTSQFVYKIVEDKPWGYALDFAFLSQITPTYDGNVLSLENAYPMAKFFAPATFVLSPGMSYRPNKNLSVLISPISIKSIYVADDSIARMGNNNRTQSLHGTPWGGTDEEAFRNEWNVRPVGLTSDSLLYAKQSFQAGATLKVLYKNKFLKDSEGKARIAFNTALTLFSDYLRNPQFIDVEWITNTDFFIYKGLSLSLGTIVFYDYDVLVQIDADGDPNTGRNGLEDTGRGVSFTQTLLIKYNFLF
jgi:hypothetical protein